MALVSMTSWAQGLTFGEVGIAPYTYGDELATDAVVKDSEGQRLTKGTDYTISTVAYSDETFATEVARSAMKAGNRYYLKITGIGAYTSQVKGVYFDVLQAELTINLVANSLDRGFGDDPVALTADMFAAPTGFKFSDDASVLKGSHPTTYATADNNVGAAKAITFGAGKFADNYNVKYTGTLAIAAKNLSSQAVFTDWQDDVEYTGKTIIPQYTVKTKAEGGVVLTQGTAPVLFATAAEYNAAKGTTLNETDFAALDEAQKIKTPGTGDFYVSTPVRNVAKYTPTITFQGNYMGTLTVADEKAFDVTPAPVTVILDDVKRVYNGEDQGDQSAKTDLVFSFSGLVGDDVTYNPADHLADFATALAGGTNTVKVDGEAKNAGTYTLKVTSNVTGYGNYAFTSFLDATLTIEKKKIEIAAKSATISLGQAKPTFTVDPSTYTLLTGDELSGVEFTCDEPNKVGKFDITPVFTNAKVTHTESGKKTDVTANYDPVAKEPKAQLNVTAGGIIVTIKNVEKFYGAEDPAEFEFAVRGLQGDDKLADFTIERDKTAENPEAVGSYILNATVANPDPEKYASVTVVPGILTIKKAQLTFTLPAQTIEKGLTEANAIKALKKDGVKVEGINNTDKDEDLYVFGVNTAILGSDASDEAGYWATLKDAAKASYEIVTKDADGKVTGIITNATGKLIVGKGTAVAVDFLTTDGKPAAGGDPEIKSDYSKIQAHAGETQNVTLTINPRNGREVPAGTKHNWAAKTWNTMVLPFEVEVATISQQLGYAIVNVVDPDKTTENNVQFKLEMDKVPANTPFCVKTTKAISELADKGTGNITLSFTGVKIEDKGEYPSVDAGNGYKFVGAYKSLTIDKTHPTYSFLRGDTPKWAQLGETSANSWTVVPFDAYVDLTGAANAREVTFTFEELDGTMTAIKAVEVTAIDNSAAQNGWYTLGGMKLQSAPTQKDVYINNGKKVVIK